MAEIIDHTTEKCGSSVPMTLQTDGEGASSKTLFIMAKEKKWKAVLQMCGVRPQDAYWRDEYGCTVLHQGELVLKWIS